MEAKPADCQMITHSRNPITHPQNGLAQFDRPSVYRLAFQPLIAVMGTRHAKGSLRALNRQIEGTRPARDTKRAPHFRRILAVDLDGIVRRRRTLPGPPRPDVVCRDARI